MATAKGKKGEDTGSTEAKSSGQGRAVMMPDGKTRRVDYITDQYYNKDVKRGDIARDLSEQFGKTINYQTVFAATKLTKEEFAKAKTKK